jgi:hypothetical protein
MGIKSYTAAPTAALALGLFFTPPVSIAIDATINTVASLVSPAIGNLSFISPAKGLKSADNLTLWKSFWLPRPSLTCDIFPVTHGSESLIMSSYAAMPS